MAIRLNMFIQTLLIFLTLAVGGKNLILAASPSNPTDWGTEYLQPGQLDSYFEETSPFLEVSDLDHSTPDPIPEPLTVCLLGLGGLMLVRRKFIKRNPGAL